MKYEVGKRYKGMSYFNEGAKFDFQQSGAILEIFYDKPTPKEIEDVKNGRFEIGFCEKSNIIFFVFRFGSGPYMDAPYTVHLSPKFEFIEIKENMGFGLNIFLIDSTSGILKVIRYIGLSTNFSMKFKQAVERQKRLKFNKSLYYETINDIFKNYSTKQLVSYADVWYKSNAK